MICRPFDSPLRVPCFKMDEEVSNSNAIWKNNQSLKGRWRGAHFDPFGTFILL